VRNERSCDFFVTRRGLDCAELMGVSFLLLFTKRERGLVGMVMVIGVFVLLFVIDSFSFCFCILDLTIFYYVYTDAIRFEL